MVAQLGLPSFLLRASEQTIQPVNGLHVSLKASVSNHRKDNQMSEWKYEKYFKKWNGEKTLHPPYDKVFLEAVRDAGFTPFTDKRIGSLFGGHSDSRDVQIIYRGHLPGTDKWEVEFYENDVPMVLTNSTEPAKTIEVALHWLRGERLFAKLNSLSDHDDCNFYAE